MKRLVPLALSFIVLFTTAAQAGVQTCTQLSGVYSATIVGNTSGASNDSATCGGSLAPEAVFFYTAPRTGTYVIDTFGSDFDTVLAVRNDVGTELSCNDDDEPGTVVQSRLTISLTQGQFVSILIDGFETGGTFTLHVNGACPTKGHDDPRDLGSPLSIAITGNTECGSFLASTTCGDGGSNASDATFLYTAPVDGTYVIDTSGSTLDTILSVRQSTCNGTEVACNDDITPVTNPQSRLALVLGVGQLLLIDVDGFGGASGAFALSINATPHSPTPTGTRTPTRSPTVSPTRTATRTPTTTRSMTSTPTTTRSPSPTLTHTQTPSRSATRTATLTRTPTQTRSRTPSNTPSPTRTATPSLSPSSTRTPSPTLTASLTMTATASHSPSRTATPTASGTQTATESATETETETPLPTPTDTPEPVPEVMLLSPCSASRFGYTCRIDFDVLPDGHVPAPFGDVIRRQYENDTGVSFPNGGWVIRPRRGANSPDFALINATNGSEQEFNAFPLPMAFTGDVTRLMLHAGLDQSIAGVVPKLTVFDSTGTTSMTVTGAEFPTGPTPIDQVIEARPGFLIARAELLYDGATPTARNAVEVIDDLLIETEHRPPCPVGLDTTSPIVAFDNPRDADQLPSTTLPLLKGTIEENLGSLLTVAAEIDNDLGSYTIDLGPYLQQTSATDFSFAVANVGLALGGNDITVRADDAACPSNRGQTTIHVDVVPPPEVNLYALGVEITQAIQDQLQVREVTTEGSDQSIFRPLPYAGVPLVADKTTIVRVYGEVVEDAGIGMIRGVPAMLIVRRGADEWRLSAPAIALDPNDQIDTASGTRDVARTLERKRADLTKSWNFVLPAAATAPGELDELEAWINPPTSFGPLECSGCNDAANHLRVGLVRFEKTASLTLGSFYLRDGALVTDAHRQTFCGGFLNMIAVRDGCGSSSANRNDFSFGLNLRFLKQWVVLDSNGKLDLDRERWWPRIRKAMMIDKGTFTPPVAYVGLGPDGLGGGAGSGIRPGAAAVTDFPGFFEEYRYGVAAQEVGHGDFLGLWHSCGTNELTGFPLYPDAAGDLYYRGSIGHVGIDTTKVPMLRTRDPATVTDYMGYTYCDRWAADAVTDAVIRLRARNEIRIGAVTPIPAANNVLALPIGNAVGALGLTFRLETLIPATTARAAEVTVRISGQTPPLGGKLYFQIDGGVPIEVRIGPQPQTTRSIVNAIEAALRSARSPSGMQLGELFAEFPWVSPFTWRYAFPDFSGAAGGAAAVRSSSGEAEYLVVSGRFGPAAQVRLDPAYTLTRDAGSSDEIGAGRFSLVLEDGAGAALFERRFEPDPPHGDFPGIQFFFETLPLAPEGEKLVLLQGTQALAQLSLSDNAPVIQVLQPNGGEDWGPSGIQTIEWSADDTDGDDLSYWIEYSPDGGSSWRTLAIDVTDTHLAIDTSVIPASAGALVRVSAADGLRTTSDQSDALFAVASKDPQIWITGAEDGAIVEPGAPLNLQANFFDADEQDLTEADFSWHLTSAGPLATGSRLEIDATDLPPGDQRIVLTVPGRSAAVSTSVRVLRVPLLSEIQSACGGDCDGNGAVTVDEIVKGVTIALGSATNTTCAAFDRDTNGAVTVDELIGAISNALQGCPAG